MLRALDSRRVSGSRAQAWGFVAHCPALQQARKTGQVTRAEEDLVAENARLRRENQELRDTNELLKAASAFSRQNQAPNVRI